MSVQNGERLATKQDLADMYQGILPYLGGSSATVLTQTLTAGSTSVTFTDIPTTGDYLIDFFTSTGINYIAINTSIVGQITLVFETQSNNVTVYCRIERITT